MLCGMDKWIYGMDECYVEWTNGYMEWMNVMWNGQMDI